MYKNLIFQNNNNFNNIDNLDLSKPSKEQTEKTIKETTEALEKLSKTRIKSYKNIKNSNFISQSTILTNTKILKYTSNNNNQKIIQITNIPEDPFDNYKFKHQKTSKSRKKKR